MAIQMSSLGFSPLLPAIQKDFEPHLFADRFVHRPLRSGGDGGKRARRYSGQAHRRKARAFRRTFGRCARALAAEPGLFIPRRSSGARVVWLIGYRPSIRLRNDVHCAGCCPSPQRLHLLGRFHLSNIDPDSRSFTPETSKQFRQTLQTAVLTTPMTREPASP